MPEAETPLPAWMGNVDPSQVGFPLEVDRSRYTKTTEIPFKKTEQGVLHLDAYRPTGVPEPTPFVLMIHGGGWRGGGRFNMGLPRWAGYLACAGFSVASIDYRLAPETSYPDSFQDCLDAFDWCVQHAQDLGADPDRMGLWGDSAGGHLALLLATSQTRSDFDGPRLRSGSERIRGVVALYPPTDLLRLHELERRFHPGTTTAAQFVGAAPEAEPERWTQASPLHQVHSKAPPTLLLQGTSDLLVPEQQALDYAARAQSLKAPHELHILQGGGHGFDRVAPSAEACQLIERSRSFLIENLHRGDL
ncbi:MAG: hypothetical protein CBC48_14180 [bacterium TMED88]|nr:hypothetical protein [Deltaproteobacteria bacterium]OUV27619.1 MAG: hypothetical protein CBC48_14180 [bacterium TMED88]